MNAKEYRQQRDAAQEELAWIKEVIAQFIASDSRVTYSDFKNRLEGR